MIPPAVQSIREVIERTRERSRQARALASRSRQLIERSRRRIKTITERFAVEADRTGDDKALVHRVACDTIRAHGPQAIAYLYQQEVDATARGDRLSAEAWAEIAGEAENLLRRGEETR